MQDVFMKTHQRNYKISISESGLEWISKEIQGQFDIKKWLIVTDENVSNIYLDNFIDFFCDEEIIINKYVIPPGEGSKSLNQAEKIIDYLSEKSFTRRDGIIAFGGGVVGDLAGFVASIYLRGIPWIQVPTTLLAQVDSSVGGKVAVNTSYGKNLIGSFYQPNGVYVDISFLKTLDPREIKSALGEVIKYACIYDGELFEILDKSSLKTMDWYNIVNRCINIKKYFVENDEREDGLRKHLNFGHTLGHALEQYHNFEGISHGEGVLRGIIFATWLSKDLGYLSDEAYMRICNLIRNYGYNFSESNYDLEKLYPMIKRDKKSHGEGIEFILIKEIGKSFIYKLSNKNLKEKLIEEML